MAHFDEEKLCLCALNIAFGFRPHISHALIDALGSARAVFELDKEGLDEIFGPFSESRGKITGELLKTAEKELGTAERIGCRFIGYNEDAYPALLAECEDFPLGIYVKSKRPAEEVFAGQDFISIVGTRDLSPYGRDWCRNIVQTIAVAGKSPCIVSGFAFGTDITAHKTAVENGLFTIGVLPSGLDSVYPRHHYSFAQSLVEQDAGALVSDYPFHTMVNKIHFMRRNRIIAGLSRATILTESRIKGGGMITCEQAFAYNRDVYALPGRVDDIRSGGCNFLIRSGVATPIVSTEDLIRSLGLKAKKNRAEMPDIATRYSGRLPAERIEIALKIFELAKKEDRIAVADMAEIIGAGVSEVSAIAGVLEADGYLVIDIAGRCSVDKKFLKI